MSVRQVSHLMHLIIKGLVVAGVLVAWVAPSAQANVYWTVPVCASYNSIGTAPLYGGVGNPTFHTFSSSHYPTGIAVFGTYIYFVDGNTGAIGRASLDGSVVTPNFIPGVGAASGVAVDGSYIYWTDAITGAIGRATLDASVVKPNFIPGPFMDVLGIAVDPNYIYFGNEVQVNGSTSTIFAIGRVILDGGAAVPDFISLGSYDPEAIAVNGTSIYWASRDKKTIGRANLDGTGNETLITGSGGPGVAVDPNYIYWSDFDSGTIGRANLDGTDPTPNFITNAGPTTCGLSGVWGVAVSPVPTCGLGIEPVPILAALLWLRGRRRRKLAEPDA